MRNYTFRGGKVTLGAVSRDVRELDERLAAIEADRQWKGDERRNGITFTDKQTDKIKELIEDHDQVKDAKAYRRLVGWVLATAGMTASALILGYVAIKGYG